jgi:hypothetical protein
MHWFFCVLFWSLCASAIAKPITLRTGHLFIDRKREVELDNFDYVYSIKKIHGRGKIIELYDGSQWKVEPLGPESESYYLQRPELAGFEFVEDLTKKWKPDEQLIFHKISNRESLLIYHLERQLLLDVTPFLSPISPHLTVTDIDLEKKLIVLSDQSVWTSPFLYPGTLDWEIADPVLIAKNTPWRGSNTHILVNLSLSQANITVEQIPINRLGVNRVNPSPQPN